jgi:hypothetical protein
MKARILESTVDKERIWEGGMTPPFWGWETQTWIQILLNGLATKMWKEIAVCRKLFSKNEKVVCFSFNLQKHNGNKNVGQCLFKTKM